MTDILDQFYLDSENRMLMKESNFEVSVLYLRAGYSPADYPTELEWEARLMMEKSCAIKCPNLAYQLVGAKKIQQILTAPGVIEKYLPDEEDRDLLTSTFAMMYSLDNDGDGDKAAELAMQNPEDYVLKPQREGGGKEFEYFLG